MAGAEIGLTAALLINSSRPPQKLTDDILPSRTEQGAAFFYDPDVDTLWTDTVIRIVVDGNNDGVPDTQKGEGTITGTVLFDDLSASPFPAVEVSAYDLPDGVEPFRTIRSDTSDGTFLLEELTDGGSFRLTFTHPWYEPATVDSVFIPVDDPAVSLGPVPLTAYTGSISGTVLPRIVVAWVVAHQNGTPVDSVLTDGSTGDYQVIHLNTGTYGIVVNPVTACYVGATAELIGVVNGADTVIEDLTLTPFGSIGGSVTPATELVTLEAVQGDSIFAHIQTTGTYRLSCLPAGVYSVRVAPESPEFAGAQRDSVRVLDGQETSGINFTLLGVSTWRFATDPVGDDHGPHHQVDPAGRLVLMDWNGHYVYEDRSRVPADLIPTLEPVDGLYYVYPTSLAFPRGSHDIHSFEVRDRDTAIEFVVTVGAVPDPANPEPYDYASWVGFLEEDAKILLQQISIYMDAGPGGSIRGLPWRGHDISEWDAWEYALALSGWWKGVIHSNGSSLRENYSVFKTDLDIDLHADFETGTISASVPKTLLGNPTEEEFAEWDILVVLCGHDCCDDDLNLGAIRWVEGAFSPEWRFQGGRSGGEGAWDGKQDPNVVDFLPLPGLGHDMPDTLSGEMMDYARPHNRIRIETDEYPVRLAATRFEDRQAPVMDFAQYFGFTAGTEANPDWTLSNYNESQGAMDINEVDAYGGGSAALITETVGASFQKSIWRDRPGWYNVQVRSIALGQTMRLLICPGSSLSSALTDTTLVTLPFSWAWIDTVWTATHLQQGFNTFRFEFAQGVPGDVSDGLMLVPAVPEGEPPLDLQIARLANTDRITIRTGIMDNMGFEHYVDAWLVYQLPGGDTLRVALGEEEGSNEWLADIEVAGLDTLLFHFELKDNAGPLNPEPSVDNFAAYPRISPEDPLTPTVRDSLLALGDLDASRFFYRIPIVEIDRFEAREVGWVPKRKNFRSPEGSKILISQSAVPDGTDGLTVSVAAGSPDAIPSLSCAPNRANLRSIGFARDIRVTDLAGGPITAFEEPIQISIHYELPAEQEAGITEGNLVLYRWEPRTSRWVFVGGRVNPDARTILARVKHLAERYAVFEDRGLERDRADFITGISFTPNPFSPNGDGIYDALRISYHLWANATITIDIYDMSGREVNNFVFEETGSPGEALGHEWDGRDTNGEMVPYGIYIVRFRAVDESEFLYRFNKAVAVIR
ncbi:MAG: gliding motility-associated C-terminal domain-containing protein [Candidatus Eisenbacteria sp.]|nr:gliding motility-associated C-terminal domain-containing protein [Candidatus Eisenbacteria bacterium]